MKKILYTLILTIILLFSFAFTSKAYLLMPFGYPTSNISIRNTSSYSDVFSSSLSAWNSSTSIVKLSSAKSSSCTVSSRSFADTWLGLYTPTLKNGQVKGFSIQLNSRLLDSKSSNYKQSVLVHELGHSLSLNDNPPESPSIMRYDRDRNTLITPQTDDINGVIATYGLLQDSNYSYSDKLISDIKDMYCFEYESFDNESKLKATSDLLVNGLILSSKLENIDINLDNNSNSFNMPYTVFEIKITDVQKGNIKVGDVIKVKIPEYDKNSFNAKSIIKNNTSVKLYLADYTKYDKNMPYSLINPKQGISLNNK